MIQIAIIDDHPIVVDGLKSLLETQPDISVTSCFSSGKSALSGLEGTQADIVLLDVNLPDINGIHLCKNVSETYPALRIIALSVHNERAVVKSMLQNGAAGYILKNAIGEDILQGIREVMNGRSYLCSATKQALSAGDDDDPDEVPQITRREREVLALVGKGLTTMEIADRLFISPHTVESHRKNLMGKFDVNNITSVIRLATKYRLL